MTYNLDGYVDVPTRIKLFMARHPEGSLQMDPPTFVEVEGKQWVIGRAYAYRTPDDQRPGIGTAWEIVPGTTNFTNVGGSICSEPSGFRARNSLIRVGTST